MKNLVFTIFQGFYISILLFLLAQTYFTPKIFEKNYPYTIRIAITNLNIMIQNIEKFLYHGSFYDNIDLSKAEYKDCLFLTPNIRYALTYSGVDDDFGGYVFMYKVNSELNIFNASNIDDRETLLAAFPEYKEYIDNMAEYEWLECFEKVADQKKIISDIKSLGYDGYFNWENKPMSGAKPFYKNLEESESYCIFSTDKVELVDVYMKDEIEDNLDFKKARQEDEALFKKEIKEYLDSGLTEEEIIEKYESDTENQYVTIPVLEAVDIVQDVADEL